MGHFEQKTVLDRRSMGHSADVDRPRKLHWLAGVRIVSCGSGIEKVDYTEDFEAWRAAGNRCKRCEKRKPVN